MSNYKLYTPSQLTKMTDTSIRREYSRLRSIANKRLSRLAKAGLNPTALSGYKYPTIKEIEQSSKSTIASELADVSKWLRSESSTIKGERKHLARFQEYMTQQGVGDIVDTPEKAYDFFKFLDKIREENKETQLPPSDVFLLEASDVLTEGERLNIPREMLIEHYTLFTSHLDQLEEIEPTKGGRRFSRQRMDALINRWT